MNEINEINEREVALDLLIRIEQGKKHSHILIRETLDRYASTPAAQRSFIKRLTEGTLERKLELDEVIRLHLKDPDKKLKTAVRCLLRMSIYQIYYMDSVPDHAACNEAVKLLKKRGLEFQSGFVNGMLRSIIRDRQGQPEKTTDRSEDMSIRYSMPELIVDLWKHQLGKEECEKLLESLLEIRPVSIRLRSDLSDADRETLVTSMRRQGAKIENGRWFSSALRLQGAAPATLPGFAEGLWTIQDESSMMVVPSAGLRGTETVFDLCAAPGGKAMHAAEMLPAGKVYAFDISGEKIMKIRENAARMKLDNIRTAVKDAGKPVPEMDGRADAVLCDVPCSGLGVIGKKRDIKYNISQEKLAGLYYLQKRILKNAVRYVRPGGVLIYSTCTINRAENEDMARYIEEELGLLPDPLAALLPEGLSGDLKRWKFSSVGSGEKKRTKGQLIFSEDGNMLQLLPHKHGTDGFFLARFKRPERKQ